MSTASPQFSNKGLQNPIQPTFKRLLKSTPLRLAIAFTVLHIVCFSIGAVTYYQTNKDRISERIDRSIASRFTAIERIYNEHGLQQTIDVIERKRINPLDMHSWYTLTTPDGDILAGISPITLNKLGWQTVTGSNLGANQDIDFRAYKGNIGDYYLTFGRSNEILTEATGHFKTIFFPTAIITALLALGGGLLLAFSTARRVKSFAIPMREVAKGDLSTRLPISQYKDDIDYIACNVNTSLALLEKQVQGMKDVSINIAHELKTPLNRLSIQLSEAIDLENSGQSVEQKLLKASAEIAQINSTFETLLYIAQLEAGSSNSHFSDLELDSVVENIVDDYQPVFEDANLELNLVIEDIDQASDKRIMVSGDKNLLSQLLANLLENAIKYCPEGSEIEVAASYTDDGRVWMSVSDNGPGVPLAERERVFERLYRLDKSRNSAGAGLGLSLAKAIATMHHGQIKLYDNNPGLRVVVMLDSDRTTPNTGQITSTQVKEKYVNRPPSDFFSKATT